MLLPRFRQFVCVVFDMFERKATQTGGGGDSCYCRQVYAEFVETPAGTLRWGVFRES